MIVSWNRTRVCYVSFRAMVADSYISYDPRLMPKAALNVAQCTPPPPPARKVNMCTVGVIFHIGKYGTALLLNFIPNFYVLEVIGELFLLLELVILVCRDVRSDLYIEPSTLSVSYVRPFRTYLPLVYYVGRLYCTVRILFPQRVFYDGVIRVSEFSHLTTPWVMCISTCDICIRSYKHGHFLSK